MAQDDVAETTVGTPIVIDVLANDSDTDSDDLEVVMLGTSSSSVVLNPDGTITYLAQFAGIETFSYFISDGQGGYAPATVTVTVNEPVAPLAATASTATRLGNRGLHKGHVIGRRTSLEEDSPSLALQLDALFRQFGKRGLGD